MFWKSAVSVLLLTTSLAAAPVDFTRDVQPIFQRSCLVCHGPKRQQGQLRLDAKAAAFKNGQVIVAGKAEESELYKRVAGLGGDARMPLGGKLTGAEIDTLKQWIDQGADWPDSASAPIQPVKKHWAFEPPVQAPIPAVSDVKWPRNEIDRFILAKLDQEQLKPSPPANRITLLRRASLDLTGLPPTPAEVDAFLADGSPNAFEKQVDRLLASKHYGEKWARMWLDAARYADSDGYEKDKQRTVWFYRDYVINAFNKDLSYKQFLTEQLAGDLLPNPTQDQIVATGFLRNSMINAEGGADPEQFRMEAMFDRIDAFGKSMLGLTVQCSQCHNHKFDPFKQTEYYQFFAYLNNSNEGSAAVYTPPQQMQRAMLFEKIRDWEDGLRHRHADWPQKMAAWEASVRGDQPNWTVLKPAVDDLSTGGARYLPVSDGSMLQQGYAPTKHKVKMTSTVDAKNITGFRLELLTDPNLPLNGPGRSVNGTGALTEFEVNVAPVSNPKAFEPVKFKRATADINPPQAELDSIFDDKSGKCRYTGPVAYAIDGKADTAWGIDAGPGRRNQPRKAVFVADKPIAGFDGGTIIEVRLKQDHGGWNSDDNQNNNLGRVRLSFTTTPDPVADPLPAAVREILSIPAERRTEAQVQTVFSYWRTTVAEYKPVNDAIEELWAQHPEPTSQLVLNEKSDRRETHLLTRGDFLKPAQVIQPGVPAFLNPLPADAPPNRLGLAQWLTSNDSPTTARSIVNRVWQAYFGTGIIATSEDLGTQSDPPSHRELLDWLAVDFMQHGWSLKRLHRQIVLSQTYRQDSKVTPEALAKDPYNRLLARGPRVRVDAEIVRDIALASSGLLSEKIGGPSVYPPAPSFLFEPPTSYGPKPWKEEKGAERYRRALYTFRYRSVPYPMLTTFDAPTADVACVRRSRSNTPLQALVTLNEPLFMETAQALAARTLTQAPPTDAARITYAFRRVLSRRPDAQEMSTLNQFLQTQRTRFAQPATAQDLVAHGTLPPGMTAQQLAPWVALSRVLLNLDETITKE